MSKWNLWQSIESALWLQRIFCVSPFNLDRSTGRLKILLLTKIYVFCVVIITSGIFYQSLFVWNCTEIMLKLLPTGMLWTILFYYEITSIHIHFLLNVLFSYTRKTKQMTFLYQVQLIDGKFLDQFHVNVNHQKHRRWIDFTIIVICLYYFLHYVSASHYWYQANELTMIPLTFVYNIDRICLSLPVYMSANYLLLIYTRCKLLHRIYRKLQLDYARNRGTSKFFLDELSKIFDLFKAICGLFTMITDAFGWIFMLIVIKSFAVILLQTYLLFYILTEPGDLNNKITPSSILYLLFGEFAGIIINITALSVTCAMVTKNFDNFLKNK